MEEIATVPRFRIEKPVTATDLENIGIPANCRQQLLGKLAGNLVVREEDYSQISFHINGGDFYFFLPNDMIVSADGPCHPHTKIFT